MKDKKYYRNYYKKNKDRINENKRLRRLAKKQLEEAVKVNFYPRDSFLDENQPFSCRNRGADPNNYKRMFIEDDLEKKEYRDYLIDFYMEKGNLLTTFNWYCFLMIILLFIFNIITNNNKVFIVNTTFQFLILTLQYINLFVHKRNLKNLEELYE